MVDFVRLQQIVRDRLEQDRNVQIVTASGNTLEDAVEHAAVLLDLPVKKLEYEIVEKGVPGFFGKGKKDWQIKAFKLVTVSKEVLEDLGIGSELFDVAPPVEQYADGDVFLHLSADGIYIKATAPKGGGRKPSEQEAFKLLKSRNVQDYNDDLISRVVREAAGEYIRVGDFMHMPTNDSTVTVEISEGEMKAHIVVTPPGYGGCDISAETFLSFLRNHRVTYGIKEDFLRDFADRPTYREKVLVAEGLNPEDGRHAYIQYNFETDQSKIKLKEGNDGRIDFKEINIIKNVVANQPLAKKIPPEHGTTGRTITGKAIPARNGKDISLPLGMNVHAGDDDATIFADINGQVIFSGGKINVEPVYTVNGDVNLTTGNIIFLGTVIINGNVEDGFAVKAAGNIVVNGSVGKAELDAEGDIIIHQGIAGKGDGSVRAGRSVWARFLENATVEAGNMVVASDGIINSQVNAHKRVVCRGKRANIVGGRIRASEEINAKSLGSPTSGAETVCEVGIDPKGKLQLDTLQANIAEMEKRLGEIQLNLQTLINIKRQRKSLPEEKEVQMGELMDKRQILLTDINKAKAEKEKLQETLNNIKSRSKVSASARVYPGVKIIIRDAAHDVRNDYKAVTFILEAGLVRMTKYEEPHEDSTRSPDGYTAN